jgi:hypothetical protein
MAEDEREIYQDAEKSEFNAGIAALMRVHEYKKWLGALTDSKDIKEYIKFLKMFYKELHPMMNPKERELNEPKFQGVRHLLMRIRSNDEITQVEIDGLEDWELELRDIDQVKNMNIPKQSDGRQALSKR